MNTQFLKRGRAKNLLCIPAMPTIYANNGISQIDAPIYFEEQKKLIEFLIAGGVSAIVVDGTTGEAATQDHDEQISFIASVVKIVDGRIPVIAGCSSNCTYEALRLTRGAIDAGASAGLYVKPYYNKPTSQGLLAHFRKIAELNFPFITYSVSSRHGGGPIPIEVIAKLAEEFSHHIGHKEAEGKPERFEQLRLACPNDFVIWSGDDGITAEVMAKNYCDGVISVAANIVPQRVVRMVELFYMANEKEKPSMITPEIAKLCPEKNPASYDITEEEWRQEISDEKSTGFAINNSLKKLFGSEGLFIQTNPQPVKTALELMGIIKKACFRLPLVPMEIENPKDVEALQDILKELHLV